MLGQGREPETLLLPLRLVGVGKSGLVFPKLTNVTIHMNSTLTMNSNFQRKYPANL